MILFPAIDLKDGRCVRLVKGDMDAPPSSTTIRPPRRAISSRGLRWLHVVDLNGAFAGRAGQRAGGRSDSRPYRLPVQLGGGIRDMAAIESWLERASRRVILGTVAVRDPDLVREACTAFPGRIVVGIDARGGKVASKAGRKTSEMTAIDLRNGSRTPASRRSSTPISIATAS